MPMRTERKQPKPKKIREQEFVDSFDEDLMEEYDDVFDADDSTFYSMYQRMERDRSLGRDELFD